MPASISTVGSVWLFAADFLRLRYGEGGEGQWDAKHPHIVPRARPLWTLAKGFGEARRATAEHLTC